MSTVSKNTQYSYTDEEKPERFLGRFIFTRKTVTFGHITLQLSNVCKIQVRSFKETIKPKYSMTERHLNTAWKVVGIGFLIFLAGNVWESFASIGLITMLAGGVGIWYYYDERKRKKDMVNNYHGLFFDCTSGKTEVLWADSVAFTAELFNRLTTSMNDERVTSFVANFHENRIENIEMGAVKNYYETQISGNTDTIAVIGSTGTNINNGY